jgi:RNA polymerase sigma factor (sigma-70 family)
MFDPTNWTNVLAAGATRSTPEQHAALDRLLRSYWRPLYLFAVRSGRSHHDAQDAVQGFFALLVERRALSRADPERGRFRNYLLRSFQNFMFEEYRKSTRLKRGGEFEFVSSEDLDAADRRLADTTIAPEMIFERRWAHAVVDAALERTAVEYRQKNRKSVFEALQDFIVGEGTGSRYSEIGPTLGLAATTVKVEVMRLRRAFREQLRREVATQVSDPHEIDEELRHLRRMMATP